MGSWDVFQPANISRKCVAYKCIRCKFRHPAREVIRRHAARKHPDSSPRRRSWKVLEMRVLAEKLFEFDVGDLVLARLPGYPRWPGMINRCYEDGKHVDPGRNEYFVLFFDAGQSSYAWVSTKRVESYDNKKAWPTNPVRPGLRSRLLAAIEWADWVVDWPNDVRFEYFNMKPRGEESPDKTGRQAESSSEEDQSADGQLDLPKSVTDEEKVGSPCKETAGTESEANVGEIADKNSTEAAAEGWKHALRDAVSCKRQAKSYFSTFSNKCIARVSDDEVLSDENDHDLPDID